MKQAKTSSSESLWTLSYIFVLLINTLNAFSFYMVATILSKHLVGIGMSISMAGTVVGLFSLTSLFCRPLCGALSDRMNNIRLLKWSNILMGVGLVGFAFSTNTILIVIFRILNGVGFSIGGTAQVALATRFIPRSKMGEGIGYLGLGMVLGSAVAPGIGLMIADSIGMTMTFLAAAALTVVAYALLLGMHGVKGDAPSAGKSFRLRDLIEPQALPFTMVSCMFSFVNGMVNAYLVLFAEEQGIAGVSVYFTIYAVMLFAIRPLSGKLMDKYGMKSTVFPGLIVTALSMLMLANSHSLTAILVTSVLRAIGQGAAQPSLQAACLNYVGRERSGTATSTYYLGGDIGQGTAPMLGGVILTFITGVTGYRTVFTLCAVLLLTSMCFFFVFVQRHYDTDKVIQS